MLNEILEIVKMISADIKRNQKKKFKKLVALSYNFVQT